MGGVRIPQSYYHNNYLVFEPTQQYDKENLLLQKESVSSYYESFQHTQSIQNMFMKTSISKLSSATNCSV